MAAKNYGKLARVRHRLVGQFVSVGGVSGWLIGGGLVRVVVHCVVYEYGVYYTWGCCFLVGGGDGCGGGLGYPSKRCVVNSIAQSCLPRTA